MFKSALWRNDRNKVKVEFKLQFHAAKVPQIAENALVISVVPADYGKPTVISDKATVRDGSCIWENPVYETVKFYRDPKSGKIHERMYYFIVGTGSSKVVAIGEACIDLSDYAEATKVLLVSLPLKHSKTEAVLHVSIQRMLEPNDLSEAEENQRARLSYKEHSLKAQFSNSDTDENIKSNSQDLAIKNDAHVAELNGNFRASSGSDVTMSSSESISGVEIPWQPQVKNDSFRQDPPGVVSSLRPRGSVSGTPTALYEESRRSQWEWLGNSAVEASTDDSSSTPRGTFLRQNSEEASDIVLEKLKSDVAALSRQAEMSELELQTLRKQIVKESKRSQDLFRELACLKQERDILKGECERLKSFQRCIDDSRTKTNSQLGGEGNPMASIEELRHELNQAKEHNFTLEIQLQKTEASNSELLLAVRDLEEMLEQKNKEILSLNNGSSTRTMVVKSEEADSRHRSQDGNDDEEQKALEELVKAHEDAKEAYLLEQQVMDMQSEIEIFKRDKDELEMQLEQLALDYEIMKQANHDMAYRLEQSQIQEQLKMQYECSPSLATSQIEDLEDELKRQSKESVDAFVRISELENHVKSLEEDLDKQSILYEADLEALTRSKVEQEQRAIKAEESLRKTRWQNANTAEKLQEEFRRLSIQMASTFAANEKVASKALAEANELRLQKRYLEEIVHKTTEEQQSVKVHYDTKLHQLSSQVMLMTDQIEALQAEIEDKVVQLELQKKHAAETQKKLSDETSKLKDEIKTYVANINDLSEELRSKETLMHQVEHMRASIQEMELLVAQGNDERTQLENSIMLQNIEAEERKKELHKVKSLAKEKEEMAGNLQSELDHLYLQLTELNHSIVENELEKEKLRNQLLSLESRQKMGRDDNSMKKIKGVTQWGSILADGSNSEISNHVLCASKEIGDHEEKIQQFEAAEDLAPNVIASEIHDVALSPERLNDLHGSLDNTMHNTGYTSELNSEMALLKERNESMEAELKEMQEMYSKLSLRFAEVESERQQLAMKLRYLKSLKKRLQSS
ncbi:uncharacterized protein LOC127255626 isoform X2 [Andrographis paniculata]|uniref:uncharacterized protein LOC127255626 isoform X2 n=1 Tax=Andrographis paniculata TaxID=175694 RepID=UPI0021E80867|nr:uncharacterized protein LOC127255626 isoform X2 [Andrographis paniculata]